MLLVNARWLAPEGRFQEGTLEVRDGRLRCHPGAGPPAVAADPPVLDARGMLVLPGLVDAHTHLREPGQARKEGVANGSRAALLGGVTTLLDMPNDRPATSTPARFRAKRERFARKCQVRWGLFVQATPGGAIPAGAVAAKLYMSRAGAGSPAVRSTAEVAAVLARYPVVAVHAEDEARFVSAATHAEARPRAAVSAALATLEAALEDLPRAARPRVVLCHAATVEDVAWLRRMKARGHDVWGETCPHYALLAADPGDPHRKVNPPLRSLEDQAAVRAALADGTLDFVSTDHAPHLPAEKASATPPSGIAAIEWLAPLLLHLWAEGVLDDRRLHEVACARAAACYGLAGVAGILDGATADLVLLRPGDPHTRPVVTRAAHRPYAHLDLRWTVAATLLGGRVACLDGTFPPRAPAPEVSRIPLPGTTHG